MQLQNIKEKLESKSIFLSEENVHGFPAVIGYEKLFRWRWFATQLNTFVVAADLGSTEITKDTIEQFINESFQYAKDNNRGWPKGLQSGIGVIAVLISDNLSEEAIAYCAELKSGKKWAGFTIPVAFNSKTGDAHFFEKYPIWGRIYYPYFKDTVKYLFKKST